MIIYGVDWSHKEEKIAVFYDGGLLKKEPDYQIGDIVLLLLNYLVLTKKKLIEFFHLYKQQTMIFYNEWCQKQAGVVWLAFLNSHQVQ